MGANYHELEDLPRTWAFPADRILLLPRGQLPLNVFEPRYLALVDAALSGTRLIGMIQPTRSTKTRSSSLRCPAIGCAGRITSYRETEDGRYLVTLTGVCRFRVAEEMRNIGAVPPIKPEFAPFLGDLIAAGEDDFPREQAALGAEGLSLAARFQGRLEKRDGAAPETLVNALAMLCPFEPAEKQALLEAPSWLERVDTLVTLLEMASAAPPGPATLN